MNKHIVPTFVVALGMLSVPALASDMGAVTRAQVKAELAALQAVGYQMSGKDPSYPAKLQAALMKIRDAGKASANGINK
ncbi:hypothetical protein WK09_11720 [Burkholderia ubonensis]|uniref:DUF4148 domain-containing protein n=1 Tax=Burkholderia ubonensis TaxID=101571 RepID=UPI0007537CD1|nr:DUF4148 domain-containing protein [Burkholderia ubonensis]KVQ91537.1 hypothetical protein WK09_11720 [Burkholderia ubonensis]